MPVSPSDRSQSKAILEKAERSKKGQHDEDHDEDDGVDRGPSLLSVDQSAITGESLASDKFIGDIAYYTCGVKRGKCYGLVTVPAKGSFVGKTAALVSGQLPHSHFLTTRADTSTGSNEKGHFQIVLGGIGTT